KPQYRNLLLRHRIEQSLYHTTAETVLLVVIHHDNLLPVSRNFRQTKMFAEVNQVQYILLKAGAAITNPGLEKLGPDTTIPANGKSHLIHIGLSRFTQCGNR